MIKLQQALLSPQGSRTARNNDQCLPNRLQSVSPMSIIALIEHLALCAARLCSVCAAHWFDKRGNGLYLAKAAGFVAVDLRC